MQCLEDGLGDPDPQVGEITYATKITSDDRHIDWSERNDEILRRVRIGGAWTTWRGERFRIIQAAESEGRIVPTVVQPAGKPKMAFDDWVRGARPDSGEWFE